MSATDNTPVNKNFLSPLNFKFQLKRAPHINFFIQKVNFPGLTIMPTQQPNPFVKIPISGDHIAYDELKILFRVDEDLQNYLELHSWIRGLGFPEKYAEYRELAGQEKHTGGGLESDISLIILNSTKLPNYELTFRDAFPVSLSELVFNSTDSDVEYIEASAVFKYTLFDLKKIT